MQPLLSRDSYKKRLLKGGTHKTVLEMFSGNGVACRLCRFSVLQVIQQKRGEYSHKVIGNVNSLSP